MLSLPAALELVIVGEPEAVAREAAELLSEAGFRVAGYLQGGLAAWAASGRPVANLTLLTIDELHERMSDYQVVDARERHKYRRGHIAGAILVPIGAAWSASVTSPPARALLCPAPDLYGLPW